MGEWQEANLDRYIEYVNRGIAPKYTDEDGIVVLNQKCIRDGRINYDLARMHNINNNYTAEKKLLPGDILINSTGVGTAGRVAIFRNGQDTLVDSHVSIVRLNQDDIDPLFLFYNLRGREKELEETAEGSTGQIELKRDGIRDLELKLPKLVSEQKEIAEVLSSLDDKIDLLHRQNQTLEALAETLFRHTFIDNAQDDWEEKPLLEFGEIVCGKTPSKKKSEYYGGNVPFIKIPDMHGKTYVSKTTDTLSIEGKQSQANKTLPPFSICVSCIATVGLVSMNTIESQTNQQINSIIPFKNEYRYFLYLHMKNSFELLQAMASGGTATLNLNTGDFSRIKISFPGDGLLDVFYSIVRPLFDKALENHEQIKTLENLRDTLLPKLMSGDVRVEYKTEAA